MSEAHKGKRHYAWGKKLSEEHRRKISESERGKKLSEEHKRAIVRYQKGKPTSAITRQKMSEAAKGEGNPFYGRRHSAETRQKMSEAHWQDGRSFEPYGLEFNAILKLAIRERDGHTCQLCRAPENGRAHCCHHIDYDKTNNEPENLVALCASCHSRTNSNRDYWTTVF